jgi:hypothetical protein
MKEPLISHKPRIEYIVEEIRLKGSKQEHILRLVNIILMTENS